MNNTERNERENLYQLLYDRKDEERMERLRKWYAIALVVTIVAMVVLLTLASI